MKKRKMEKEQVEEEKKRKQQTSVKQKTTFLQFIKTGMRWNGKMNAGLCIGSMPLVILVEPSFKYYHPCQSGF